MKTYQIAFWIFIFFIGGIAFWGFGLSMMGIVIGVATASCMALFLFVYTRVPYWMYVVGLVWMVVVGAWYYQAWTVRHFERDVVMYGLQEVSATIISYPRSFGWSQGFLAETDQEHIVSVFVSDWHQFSYGDRVLLSGTLAPLDDDLIYLKKDRVVGIMDNPAVVASAPMNGFSIKKVLYGVRERFSSVFSHTLSRDHASLASGILLGKDSAFFSYEFKEAMKNSGTTHLVALSGFNVTVLINGVFLLLTFVMSKRRGALVALCGVVIFVVMTGAEASVVRAALMGSLLVVAQLSSRLFSFPHAAAVAGFVMLLFNPSLLQYDVGFLLSFVALFGIVSLGSSLSVLLRANEGWWAWSKKAFCETVSAQMMVLPIIAFSFHSFSLWGVLSNVLILSLIPFTMGVGFVVGVAGLIAPVFSSLLSFVLAPLLWLEVLVIRVFGGLPLFEIGIGWVAVVGYYLVMLVVVKIIQRKASWYGYRAV
jgi:competence protein ComEC